MTRSHGKHHTTATPPPPPAPAEANGLKAEVPPTADVNAGISPLFRVVIWVWALAFVALLFQAFLDLIFGALFGLVGR